MKFDLEFGKPFLIFSILLRFCVAIDTINPTQSITDGNTLVSAGEEFKLGFFGQGSSTNRYVGIWYSKISEQTVVWVANRENPINDSSGVLAIKGGNIEILDGRSNVLWSTNLPIAATKPSARLLDSGNLVLTELNHDNNISVLWQSFDYPTDTLLPGMKLGLSTKTGLNWSLSSWKSRNDPARGDFALELDPRGKPQLFLLKGFVPNWRSGPWNGLSYGESSTSDPKYLYDYTYISNNEESYYIYELFNASRFSMLKIDESGKLQQLAWNYDSSRWNRFWSAPSDQCDNYAACGAFSSCNPLEIPWCTCLRGFEPKSPQNWRLRDGSDGCIRRKQLECGKGDGFFKLENVKMPDTWGSRVDPDLNLKECEERCLNDCNCTAYASNDIWGSGCLSWFAGLVDIKDYPNSRQDIYIRVAASELVGISMNGNSKGFHGKVRTLVIVMVTATLGMLLIVSFGYFFWRRKMIGRTEKGRCNDLFFNLGTRRLGTSGKSKEKDLEESSHETELPIFDIDIVVAATNNFSSTNKLGEGGFGPVYKGMLANGVEIAVKRLSKNSGQGREEFENEVTSISKLQHRNLVGLRACCIQGEERMLIYEYMPNKSLDSFIFDQRRRMLLDWRKRFDIISGIARGVLYLHQDSKLRIIHRDLKSSNILLDSEMNPKISDFGIARIFCGNQTQGNTKRVVGTHGYMSPEYAMYGIFSTKSDVFSFGVILLEIISGKKNSGYGQHDNFFNLLGHVWFMWQEGRSLEILDSFMHNSCPESEVLRCIQVGLLCVQESATDRPTMSSVVFLLSNETIVPLPKQPAFSMKENVNNPNSLNSRMSSQSISEVTITRTLGR